MSVMLQAFYWDCPAKEKQEHNWWNFVADHVEDLSKSGFNALWLPPISKAAETRSMGYDPYDYFDLGDLDQKGSKKTWFGNRAELVALIKKAHDNRIACYADMVILLWFTEPYGAPNNRMECRRASASDLRQAAVDGELAGGHEAAVLRREKGSRRPDLRRIGHALERSHRGVDLLALLT